MLQLSRLVTCNPSNLMWEHASVSFGLLLHSWGQPFLQDIDSSYCTAAHCWSTSLQKGHKTSETLETSNYWQNSLNPIFAKETTSFSIVLNPDSHNPIMKVMHYIKLSISSEPICRRISFSFRPLSASMRASQVGKSIDQEDSEKCTRFAAYSNEKDTVI